VGGQHPTSRVSIVSHQQKCADSKSLIDVSPQSLTKDPHPQTIATGDLESAVTPHLNATHYS